MQSKSVLAMGMVFGLTVAAGGAAFIAMEAAQETALATSTDFPAEAMRTAKTPPHFELQDQDGESVTLEQLRGKVVILTAVYASCHAACPTIISNAKAALDRLDPAQRDDVVIVAITLDPEGDTQSKRAMTAEKHGLHAPQFRYVNGSDPAAVLAVIDKLGWARAKADDSDVIGHSNQFLLVDRKGKIAYDLSANSRQDWLDAGLQQLLAESP